jgi:hypothetical protein
MVNCASVQAQPSLVATQSNRLPRIPTKGDEESVIRATVSAVVNDYPQRGLRPFQNYYASR